MARTIATLLIWVMFTTIVIALTTSATGAIRSATGSELFGIIAAIAVAATLSTAAVWRGSKKDEDEDESMARSLAKSKRRLSRRAEDILESLDDEEVYDLEALLLSREHAPRGQRSDPKA